MLETGVDTWRMVWPAGTAEARHLAATCRVPTAVGYRAQAKIGGYRLGWAPGRRVAWAEGHPAGESVLARPSDLPAHFEQIATELVGLGLLGDPAAAMVSRLDTAATIGYPDPSLGLALLTGIAMLRMPRAKVEVHGYPPETVYFKSIKAKATKFCRIYDFGLSRRVRERGSLIRFEDQRRFASGQRPCLEDVSPAFLRDQFGRRFLPLFNASKEVRVMGPYEIAVELADHVELGEMSAREAERMVGFIVLEAARPGRIHSRSTWYRRQRELAEHGLVAFAGSLDPLVVRPADAFEAVLDDQAWGCSN